MMIVNVVVGVSYGDSVGNFWFGIGNIVVSYIILMGENRDLNQR
jgi:hypothetical protein